MDRQQTNLQLIATLAERLGEHLIAAQVRAQSIMSQSWQDDPARESPWDASRRRQLEGKINRITGILNYQKVDYSPVPMVPDFAQLRTTPEGRRRYYQALEMRLKALDALNRPIGTETEKLSAKVLEA